MKSFRGYINTHTAADLKKEKQNLSKRAQNYLLHNIGNHDENPNIIVHKLDNSGYICIDVDDKYTFDHVEKIVNNYDFSPNGVNKTRSISNVFRNDEGENKYKHHYWFSTDGKNMQKMLGVNGTKLDILGKDLVFEVIGHEHREQCYDINFFYGLYNKILRIPNPKGTDGPPIPPPSTPAAAEEVVIEGGVIGEPSVPFEEKKAWIDKNTKAVDARTYKTWSETLFKIHNKYNGNNIGRTLAHYFSQKDSGYNAEKVDTFWNNIKTEKISACVFGLTRVQLNESLDQLFLNYQKEIIELTKNRNKKEKTEDEIEEEGEDTTDAICILKNPTDEAVSIEAFKKLKNDFVYSRGQYFFKIENFWSNKPDVFKSALRSAILKLKILFEKKIINQSGKEKIIILKYCAFVSKLNAVATLVQDAITMMATDDTFYDKLHTSVKGKLVFQDGVYDFANKEFYKWGCEHLLKNSVYAIAACPHNFPPEDSVTQEFKNSCIDKIYGSFTKSQQNDLLHFLARAAGGHIEDKNFAQQLMNRDSGKGIQCDWISYAFGQMYVGVVDYTNFLVQQNTGEDSAKANAWLMPFQFKRFMLSNESKGDINDKKIKIDGGKIKSICSGGDSIEARALFCNVVNILIQSTLMILCNEQLACSTPDVFEKCLQITGQCQYKSQNFIDDKMQDACPELKELYSRQYQLEDATLKDKVKTPEWSRALIRILIDNYKTTRVHIAKVDGGQDENEMSLNENILENYTQGGDEDFISNDELKKNAEEFSVSMKKLKLGIKFCIENVKEGKHRTDDGKREKGLFGIKYKNIDSDKGV